jgi:hypothetical protein
VHGGNNWLFAVRNGFAVRAEPLPCAIQLCRAPAHGNGSLPCPIAFAVRQGIAKHLCHVLLHDKHISMFEH